MNGYFFYDRAETMIEPVRMFRERSVHFEHAANEYRQDLYSWISDVSKDAQGFRTRLDIRGMTTAELHETADYFERQAEITAHEERECTLRCQERFEERVRECLDMGAPTRKRAVEWILDGEGMAEEPDPGYIQYSLGIGYRYDIWEGKEA